MDWFWNVLSKLATFGVASVISASQLLAPSTQISPVNSSPKIVDSVLATTTTPHYTMALYMPEITPENTTLLNIPSTAKNSFVSKAELQNILNTRTYGILSHVYWLLSQQKNVQGSESSSFVTNDFFQKQIARVYDITSKNISRSASSVTNITNINSATGTFSGTTTTL